jgi:glycosyltransferase involved in cell wall biosynthesis
MRRVLIGTPTYDGTLTAHYVDALLRTLKEAPKQDIEIFPLFICYDALVQRARNDIVKQAISANVDDLVFIDADIGWEPEAFFRLLRHPVQVVGGVVPKKCDNPAFNVKVLPGASLEIIDGVMEVECVGTGILRITQQALQNLWTISEEYQNEGPVGRMVFDIKIIDGQLVSEDNIFCHKWRDLGGKVWLDPYLQCTHTGTKTFTANFMEYLEANRVRE